MFTLLSFRRTLCLLSATSTLLPPLVVLVLLLLAVCSTPVHSTASPPPSSSSSSAADRQSRDLYCALCESVMDEMESAIARIERQHAHTVQTAWRIDEKRRIPYARTESVLLQLLEDDVPLVWRHYGVSNHTGRQRLLRRADAPQLDRAPLLPEGEEASQQNGTNTSGSSNSSSGPLTVSAYSASEFTFSPLMTDTLTALYDRLLDSYLEDIILAFHRRQHDDNKQTLCVKTIKACRKGTTFEPFRRPTRQGQAGQGQAESDGQASEQIGHVDL